MYKHTTEFSTHSEGFKTQRRRPTEDALLFNLFVCLFIIIKLSLFLFLVTFGVPDFGWPFGKCF